MRKEQTIPSALESKEIFKKNKSELKKSVQENLLLEQQILKDTAIYLLHGNQLTLPLQLGDKDLRYKLRLVNNTKLGDFHVPNAGIRILYFLEDPESTFPSDEEYFPIRLSGQEVCGGQITEDLPATYRVAINFERALEIVAKTSGNLYQEAQSENSIQDKGMNFLHRLSSKFRQRQEKVISSKNTYIMTNDMHTRENQRGKGYASFLAERFLLHEQIWLKVLDTYSPGRWETNNAVMYINDSATTDGDTRSEWTANQVKKMNSILDEKSRYRELVPGKSRDYIRLIK